MTTNRSLLATFTLLSTLTLAACGVSEDVPRRGTEGALGGKADALAGSCVQACGGQSHNGSCYCDAECASYGDCCADKLAVCNPTTSCGPYPLQFSPTSG